MEDAALLPSSTRRTETLLLVGYNGVAPSFANRTMKVPSFRQSYDGMRLHVHYTQQGTITIALATTALDPKYVN